MDTSWRLGARVAYDEEMLAFALPDRHAIAVATPTKIEVIDPVSGATTWSAIAEPDHWLNPREATIRIEHPRRGEILVPAHVAIAGCTDRSPAHHAEGWHYMLRPLATSLETTLCGPADQTFSIKGDGDLVIQGFSDDGKVFVLMTTCGIYAAYRG